MHNEQDPAWVKRWLCLGINSWEPVCGLAGQVSCISPSHPHPSCNIQSYKKRDPSTEACHEDLGRRSQYCKMSVQLSNSGVKIFFVKITDSSKRVVSPVRPTIAWAGRAWLMLDLLNKRAARRRRLGPAARCPPGLAWGLSSNKYTIIEYFQK